MSFFEDASLVLIPSGIKNQKIYSVKPTDGTGDLTFSRASNATRVASNGLIEKVRTNLALYSQDWTNWTLFQATATANTTANPLDGAVNADTLTISTATTGVSYRSVSTGTGIATFSAYLKAGTHDQAQIGFTDGTDFAVNVDLTLGTITGVSSGITGTITSVGSGWYRVTATRTISNTSTPNAFVNVIVGTVGDSVIVFGAQAETGDIATDYIATTSAAVSVGPVSGLPRLDYLNSSCPKLLLEPQRTNLALQSESATTSVTNVGYTATSNVATSPDGFASADLLLEDTSTLHLLQKEFSVASTTDSYAVSFFVKANGRTSGRILYGLNGAPFSSVSAIFNLTAGTITAPSADAPAVAGTSKIENYGNGWYRVSVSGVIGTAGTHYARIQDDNGGVAGDPTKGFQVWGFQAELGAYATSYIPTLGTSVTRVADAASKTGISSLIGQTEGTIYWEGKVDGLAPFNESLPISLFATGATTSGAQIYVTFLANGRINFVVYDGATVQAQVQTTTSFYTLGTNIKIAAVYKANDFALYINGVQIGTDTSGSVVATSELYLDYKNNVGNYSTSQVLLFKTRLTTAQLAELTTL
jgi:hypothetical protein